MEHTANKALLSVIDKNSIIAEHVPIYQDIHEINETIGFITNVGFTNNTVRITGAATTFDGRRIDELIVFLNKKPISPVTCHLKLDSPEFGKEFPGLPSSFNCGFSVEFSLYPENIDDIYSDVFFICPMIQGVPSIALTGTAIAPHFQSPQQKDVEFVGGNFFIVGFEFLGHLIKYTDLAPHSRVLDIGCGCGRIAYPLSAYLSREGFYDGFDIWDAGIQWSQENIASRNSRFHFKKVDLYNKMYNPGGKIKPDEFFFPYAGNSFDTVFLTSVFTHMFARDVSNYLKEIHRVLKTGGSCLFTCWMINDESLRLMKKGACSLKFDIALHDCYTTDQDTPENAIAFDESWFDDQLRENNFAVQLKRYGYWCGRDVFTSYQDIVVIKKCG